jgi:hypothetical protein
MTGAGQHQGLDRPSCGGKLRPPRDGTCTLPPGWGTDHKGIGCCKLHGGSTPNHRAAARAEQARRSEAEALRMLAGMDLPPMGDPLTALGKLASLAMAMVDVARDQLAALESMVGPDHLGDERTRAHVQLLERFMAMAQRHASDLARLNLDERMAEMHARSAVLQGGLMLGLVRAIVIRLGRSLDEPDVGSMVAEEFRALEARGGNGGS